MGALFRNSPLPSSDRPEPDLEFLSKFSPFLVLLLLPHMILDHQSVSLVSWLSVVLQEMLQVISYSLDNFYLDAYTLVMLVFPHFSSLY